MDGSIWGILPHVPSLLKTALFHTIYLSPTSTKWDLKTELLVNLIKVLIASPMPSTISHTQSIGLRDPGISGKMWISKITCPRPPEDSVVLLLCSAIDTLKRGNEAYAVPHLAPVEAEWTGYRANARQNTPRPNLPESDQYAKLMKEVSSPVTILYLHGGAYFLMDPASMRTPTSRLAHLTHGRLLSVRYRLAPQNPFPAALLDAFVSYLHLLSPTPGAPHEPVAAQNIVFAGDSAGGGLCLCLLQLLLQLRRQGNETVRFHGKDVKLQLPAGVACNSAWVDLTRCMPSIVRNARYDYLPPPVDDITSHIPPCPLWPTDPPRGDLYCDLSMLCHPLVSPLAAQDWTGACPLWLLYGEEMLQDEGAVLAKKAHGQGVAVKWSCWEAMPHCFPMVLMLVGSEASRRCLGEWAEFMVEAVGKAGRREKMESQGRFVEVKSLKVAECEIGGECGHSDSEVEEWMRREVERRAKGEEGEAKILPRL